MKELDAIQEINRGLLKTYRSRIWSKFTKAISEYQLISKGDKIAVCISGGKDSMLLAKCMQMLHEHSEVDFDIVYLSMNPGFSSEAVNQLKENAKRLGIDLTVFDTNIFEILDNVEDKSSPCFLCARMRRGALYKKAKELGCNKIALGHHFDDVIETTMISLLYGGKIQSMMPKLHSDNYEGMELIRPLFYVREKDVLCWANKNNLNFSKCSCTLTTRNLDSKREEVKNLIGELENKHPGIENNIFKSMYNVNVDTAIAYQKDTITYHFLDTYGRKDNYNTNRQFERLERMYDKDSLDRFKNKKVAIFGIGGVGGYVCEALARSGLNNFYLYDGDVVDITNINRQIIATFKTLKQDKVKAMKDRILSINPTCDVKTYKMFVNEDSLKDICFENFDYIVDAIDDIKAKILLIKKAKELNIPIISSMGAGNKYDCNGFKIMDINQTKNDPLARIIRHELKLLNITHVKVCCSLEINETKNEKLGSNPFTVPSCGLLIANEVFNDLKNDESN